MGTTKPVPVDIAPKFTTAAELEESTP